MAYTNISNLVNSQPLNLSFTNLTTPLGAVNQIKQDVQGSIGDLWFTISIVVIFLFLTWIFYRSDRSFFMDFTRSILISSSWCALITMAFLLSGWIKTGYPLIWFLTIWVISIISAIRLKAQGT